MSVVFDSLVQRFLNDERYANDTRYVDYCIKCASFYADPVALYSYVFSKGVGTRTAALYVAWARHFEQKGLNEQADAVYQKAVENQAQPADAVLQEYRQFQIRTRSQTPGSGSVAPLQTSHLTNQMSSHREPVAQSKTSVDLLAKPPAVKTVVTLSRSENSGVTRSHQDSGVHTVSEYLKDELLRDGTELSFEEARAARYFRTLQERQQRETREMEDLVRKQLEGIRSIKSELEKVDGVLANQPASQKVCVVEAASSLVGHPTQQPLGRPPRPWNPLSSRRSLGLTLLAKPTFMQDAAVHEGNHPGPADTSDLSAEVSQHPSVLPDRSVHLQQPALNPAPTHPACPRSEQENQPLHRPVSAPTPVPALVQPSSWEHNHTHHDVSQLQEPEEKLNMSQGGSVNLSHVTPNTSLGFVQATPSRVLPSPTVNTREALDLIMDMFQAPTLLEDPFDDSSVVHAAEREFESRFQRNGGSSVSSNPPASAPFTIFQDDNDKENASAPAAAAAVAPAPAPNPAPAPAVVEKPKPARALAEIPVSKPEKPNETPPDLMPDESAMWGARYNPLNSLAACPNNTTDFAMLAQFVSTPFTHKTPFSSNFYPDRENTCDGSEADDDAFTRHQPKKLSPIIEQSPSEETLSETGASRLEASSVRRGTIVGEGLAATASRHCMSSSSITMVQPPPPAVLSFRDHTLCPTESSSTRASSWEDFSSPEQAQKPSTLPLQESEETSVQSKTEPFKIMEDEEEPAEPDQNQKPVYDVPMSPDCALKPDWMTINSPEAMVQPDLDLDVFLSPHRPSTVNRTQDVHMSPEQLPLGADVPMSPPMTPERAADVYMDAETPRAARTGELRLVSDPWDNDLVCDLLTSLTPPLTAHPRCITWQCNLPNITPKMTISIGKSSLRVDCVLGQGAFATVYQATDPVTSERMALKVQKPANPWEFYIHTQLDTRLSPDVRHLYGSVRSAHLFHNASVLLEELHNYGTLLNVVNMYKCLSDKVMPQPLVIYFTVCILHMVELLHSVHIVHADIKPDNFLLGERFLENKCFDSENVDHGLVLIDLGQSIDMTLFPQGTAFTAKCLTSGFQCTEMLSGKPWNYQTDYFGIAGTVYCLLFGTYMQVTNEGGVWRTNAVFRRNPHSDLWLHFFDTLLNIPDCGSLPSLRRLRGQLTGVLQQSYSSKLSTLKSRLVVQLLESRKTNRR